MTDTTQTAIPIPHDGGAHFCADCGHELADGPFCPACGHPVPEGHAAHIPETVPEEWHAHKASHAYSASPVEDDGGSGVTIRLRHPLVIIGLLVLTALLVTGAFVWQSNRAADNAASKAAATLKEYRRDVKSAFDPVRTANIALSRELAGLSGVDRTSALRANESALDATTSASGALAALDAPKGGSKLQDTAKDVVELERAYLEQVIRVLENPAGTGATQLPVLAADLKRAISSSEESVFGSTSQISGIDEIVVWAPVTAAKLKQASDKKKANAKAQQQKDADKKTSTTTTGAATTGQATTRPSNPFANGRDCGDGVYAGANTSCNFAVNVRDAYWNQPGAVTTVRVYSPVTNRVYTMSCAPSGWGVTCTGGNNASVAF